jgi:hypothetical protein
MTKSGQKDFVAIFFAITITKIYWIIAIEVQKSRRAEGERHQPAEPAWPVPKSAKLVVHVPRLQSWPGQFPNQPGRFPYVLCVAAGLSGPIKPAWPV